MQALLPQEDRKNESDGDKTTSASSASQIASSRSQIICDLTVEFSTWAVCERLLPQVYACAELINQWGFEFPEAARLLNENGFYLRERARYADAYPLYALN